MFKLYTGVLLWLSVALSFLANAEPIDSLRASQTAANYLKTRVGAFSGIEFAYKGTADRQPTPYYIFNLKNKDGFVIIIADDACYPVLGYSTDGGFDPGKVPVQLAKMLWHRSSEVAYIRKNGFKADESIKQAWRDIEHGGSATARIGKGITGVAPLVATRWDQSPFYNDLCPYDVRTSRDYGSRAVTGCVATAMAQIMKYHNFPKTGQGIHTYTHNRYGQLSADFSRTTYDWANMPPAINSRNVPVATLMYHCGVSLDMGYDIAEEGGSGVSSLRVVSDALKKYFGYGSTVRFVDRGSYTESAWTALIKTELDARRPVQYAGIGKSGGHSFVCDGYNDSGDFHINWGWGGQADAYFRLTALNPGSLGTGGGEGGFNSGQQAVIGIQPAAATTPTQAPIPTLQLAKKLTATPNPLTFGADMTVSFNIVNRGNAAFQGDYGVALFDKDYEFIGFVGDVATNYNLPANNTYTTDLAFTQKSLFLSAGDYYIGAYSRESQKEWQLIAPTTFENPTKINVQGVARDLSMFGTVLKASSDPIVQNAPFEVIFNVANLKSTAFDGDLRVALYNQDGTFAGLVGEQTGIQLATNKTFTNPLIIKTTGLDVPPGTYILAPTYKTKTGTSYLALSAYTNQNVTYPNLIRVVVAAPALIADKFEANDKEAQATTLPVTFNSNVASVLTEGSNLHVGNDVDHYKLTLPTGYDYELTARVHDSDNSGNGKTYSADALFSYRIGTGNYSDAFDVNIDEINSKLTLINGGTVILKVAPFFSGDKGTYLLDVQVTRKQLATIAVTAPRSGDRWPSGSTQQITYVYSNLSGNVRIDLYRGNAFVQTLVASTPATGQFAWSIPDNFTEGTDYRIVVTSLANTGVQAVSNTFSIFKLILGVENESFSNQVSVYPNPASGMLSVKLPANTALQVISLLDAVGRPLWQTEKFRSGDTFRMDLSTYPAGMYFLQIESDKGVGIKKISLVK